ncbi:hypothetical protein [Saccharopolyspora griseoalba]|uniref:Uncharacterized protein n=1 Tax=Saccharopolyspora griseoalba TaxID=1431848 RepID=A0ABW2LUL6_9PSEU
MSPIRTASRQATTLRTLTGWPLRSPTHALLTAAGMLAAAVLIGLLLQPANNPSPPPAAPPPSTPPPEPTKLSPAYDPALTDESAVRDLADRAAEAWTRHPPGMPSEAFAAQFNDLALPEYQAQLRTIAPDNIREATVTGPAQITDLSGGLAQARVPALRASGERVDLTIEVQRMPQGWRVNRITAAPGGR